MRTSFCTVCIAVAVGIIAAPLSGQEITYIKKTTTEMGGSLGDLMRLVPGAGGDQEERVQISVPLKTIRTDQGDDQTTIVNFATGDIKSLDHDERTWMLMNFGQLPGILDANPSGQVPAQYQPPPPSDAGIEMTYEAQISTDRTGDFKDLLGYRAELVILRVDLVPTRAPEGQSLDEMPTHVIVTAMWIAEDFPGNEAMRALTAELGGQVSGGNFDGLAAAFAQSPALKQAFEENGEELAKLGGLPLEQIIAFTTLPAGVTYDMDKALHGELGGGSIDIAGAARAGLEQAARGGIGGLLGRRGRRPEPEPEAPVPAPVQMVLVRMHEVLTSFDQNRLPAGWDQIPDGYEEMVLPFQRRN